MLLLLLLCRVPGVFTFWFPFRDLQSQQRREKYLLRLPLFSGRTFLLPETRSNAERVCRCFVCRFE